MGWVQRERVRDARPGTKEGAAATAGSPLLSRPGWGLPGSAVWIRVGGRPLSVSALLFALSSPLRRAPASLAHGTSRAQALGASNRGPALPIPRHDPAAVSPLGASCSPSSSCNKGECGGWGAQRGVSGPGDVGVQWAGSPLRLPETQVVLSRISPFPSIFSQTCPLLFSGWHPQNLSVPPLSGPSLPMCFCCSQVGPHSHPGVCIFPPPHPTHHWPQAGAISGLRRTCPWWG